MIKKIIKGIIIILINIMLSWLFFWILILNPNKSWGIDWDIFDLIISFTILECIISVPFFIYLLKNKKVINILYLLFICGYSIFKSYILMK